MAEATRHGKRQHGPLSWLLRNLSHGRLPLLLLLAGLVTLAFISLSWHVEDPDSVSGLRRNLHAAHGEGSGASSPLRLMLASHGRLLWYYPDTDTSKVLHEGQGVHYGTFPGKVTASGELSTVWVVVRPHNWHPATTEEVLLELDADTGQQLSRIKIPSRFTHDAVRHGDSVFLCNTEQGSVLQLEYPTMRQVRSMQLFTKKQHVNTLALLAPDQIWAVLHNLGKSEMVQIKVPESASAPAAISARLIGVGTKSHGLVEWRGGFVSLDSENAQLVWVEQPPEDTAAGGVQANVKVLWKVPDEGKFLKGLVVVDGVAYFGVSVFAPRSARQDPEVDSELAAYDIEGKKLLWRRQVPTRGLLNVVSAPQLGEDSTFRALSTSSANRRASSSSSALTTSSTASSTAAKTETRLPTSPPPLAVNAALEAQRQALLSKAAVQEASKKLTDLGFPAKVGGHWATGLPFLDLAIKATHTPWDAGLQLPLTTINVSALQALVRDTPASMWEADEQRKSNVVIDGRKGNTEQFKPGVRAIILQFSDQSIDHTYRFPYYNFYKAALEPLLDQVIGQSNFNNIVRMQLAMMPVGSTIKLHRDMGGYALKAHRIHLPVFTNADVTFQVCPKLDQRTNGHGKDSDITQPDDCVSIPMAEGMVFELNNRVVHRVLNGNPSKARIQLVVDVAEAPRAPVELKPGTNCNYVHADIVCEGVHAAAA